LSAYTHATAQLTLRMQLRTGEVPMESSALNEEGDFGPEQGVGVSETDNMGQSGPQQHDSRTAGTIWATETTGAQRWLVEATETTEATGRAEGADTKRKCIKTLNTSSLLSNIFSSSTHILNSSTPLNPKLSTSVF